MRNIQSYNKENAAEFETNFLAFAEFIYSFINNIYITFTILLKNTCNKMKYKVKISQLYRLQNVAIYPTKYKKKWNMVLNDKLHLLNAGVKDCLSSAYWRSWL